MWGRRGGGSVAVVTDSTLQAQLDEVRALLARAKELFGEAPVAPPADIAPAPDAVQTWVR
ncbi:hypothetical protein MMUR_04920 [Mycolicibacterium murale]|uniref:Uncharacterized protein n=1 Tax=Mycolicibacterium murale TaxID=182220 RepID=A0A7I9WGE1_9MYCO|nr:hypothetical protein MMUR_04920 [Mycolicibacterium murale]